MSESKITLFYEDGQRIDVPMTMRQDTETVEEFCRLLTGKAEARRPRPMYVAANHSGLVVVTKGLRAAILSVDTDGA